MEASHNYAVKLSISNDHIHILGKNMPIQIIDSWEVSIRPCELKNFAKIFGVHEKLDGTNEYKGLMQYLSETGINLVELIDFTDDDFNNIKKKITKSAKVSHIFNILEKCRRWSKDKEKGYNLIRYLLYRLNNKIIKKQYKDEACEKLSNLNVAFGCISFDEMPFNFSPKNHNPKLTDLFDCLDPTNREHELFARLIENKTRKNGNLYTAIKEIENFKNINTLIDTWNEKLYKKHQRRRLEVYKEHVFIKEYEEYTRDIIKELKKLSATGIKNYESSVNSWLESENSVDCNEKEKAIKKLFADSKVALIYGAAGTGKSTMINHISNFFNDEDKHKLLVANTNSAVDNLRRKVKAANCTFKTIKKFLNKNNRESEFDILIIDECSTINNSDMIKVLEKASYKLLVLVGDVYQIESISFGNWFSIIRSFIPESSVFELTKPYRNNNDNLLTLWKKVRKIKSDILEYIIKNEYATSLDESIFEHTEDEIILCLNYDGLYGINNTNKLLQNSNTNVATEWGIHTYKVNDPIIFNETNKFSPSIYNNLKGRIDNIEILKGKIQFDIEIDRAINEIKASKYDFQLMDNAESGNSIIRFTVNKSKNTDEDDNSSDTIVPFQVAYAVSIHKAQGLEYSSVKVVITNEVDEMISHNIFYTAITRARDKLKIYWTPESEKKILESLKTKSNKRDIKLLESKLKK